MEIHIPADLYEPGHRSISPLGRQIREADRSLIEERIEELLSTEKDVVILHNTLFSQYGLFHQLAGSKEERQRQKNSALYQRAKMVVNDMILAAEAELRNRLCQP